MKQEEPDKKPSVAIIGVVGVPGAYGGFETLADELIQYAEEQGVSSEFIVYCSGQKPDGPLDYCGAERRFVAISANGIASILYDILTCLTHGGAELPSYLFWGFPVHQFCFFKIVHARRTDH